MVNSYANQIDLIVNNELDRNLEMLRKNPSISTEAIIQYSLEINDTRKLVNKLLDRMANMNATAVHLTCEPY